MTQPKAAEADARISKLEERITHMELYIAERVPGFEQTARRVGELAAAFGAANDRLRDLEARVDTLAQAEPPDTAELEGRIEELSKRLARVETAGNRRGRLSSRLADIGSKLDQLEGGTDDAVNGVPTVPVDPS